MPLIIDNRVRNEITRILDNEVPSTHFTNRAMRERAEGENHTFCNACATLDDGEEYYPYRCISCEKNMCEHFAHINFCFATIREFPLCLDCVLKCEITRAQANKIGDMQNKLGTEIVRLQDHIQQLEGK